MTNIEPTHVTTSAPGKLLLLGDHAVVSGYPCIVTAVDQRILVTVAHTPAQQSSAAAPLVVIHAPDVGVAEYQRPVAELGQGEVPKGVRFIERVCYRFWQRYGPLSGGVSISTKSDFSALFGFGSSSATTVAVAHGLAQLYHVSLTFQELFELCYQVVLDIQGVGSGFDIAAAIWGGTLYYVSPAQVVRSIVVPELPLIVGYTGQKVDTASMINQVRQLQTQQPDLVAGVFSKSAWLVNHAEKALVAGNWQLVGELMNTNQALLAQLQVNSERLDELITAATQSGAYGAKLSGAGGGDCMIAITPANKLDRERVALALTQAGGQVIPITTHAPGVRVEKEN